MTRTRRRRAPIYQPQVHQSPDAPYTPPSAQPRSTQTAINHIFHFPTLSALLDYTSTTPCQPEYEYYFTAHKERATDWAGTSTFAEAVALAKQGWQQGLDNMVQAIAHAKSITLSEPSYDMDVAGAFPIVALAVAGDPMNMVTITQTELAKKPVVRLAVNIWASCAYSKEEFTNYGAALLSYVDALERNNTRVELTAMCHCRSNDSEKETYTCLTVIKRAEEPLELDRLAYVLSHASFLRRICFAHLQQAPGMTRGSMRNCGSPHIAVQGVHTDTDQLVTPNINTFSPGCAELRSSTNALKALAPLLDTILSDNNIPHPELAFGGSEQD